MEKEMLKEICEKYCKKERFILLLYKIAKTNNVNNIEESITSFSTTFKVFPSILTDTNKPTETSSDYPILKKLIEDIENLKNSGQISHGHDNKSILDSITSTKVNNWDKAYTHSQSLHFSGNYNDLTNKPTIPSNTSDLTNDSGFATETYVGNAIANAQLGSGGEVDLSGYVTKEIGNASQITFSDGQTFQEKLDTGILKGDRGEQGPQGIPGEKGDSGEPGIKGEDGKSISIKASLNSVDMLPTSGISAGDGYIINGDLWMYTGTATEDETHHNGFENVGRI